MDLGHIETVIVGILTVSGAMGFGWFVVAPFYKWALRARLKNNMKLKSGK
jgi:hypothetical protein